MNAYDFFQNHCGRNAGIFVIAICVFFGGLILIPMADDLMEEFPAAFWAVTGVVAVIGLAVISSWTEAAIRRKRMEKEEKWENIPLSRNEICAARSKLRTSPTSKRL